MITIFLINSLVVTISVIVHYEFLYHMTMYFKKRRGFHRYRIVLGVLGSLVAHAIEVWIFAIAYYFITVSGRWGSLEGSFSGSLMDCVYFSFTVFSTLGFGDIQPSGEIRYLTGIESLTGLLLIAWSASFLYFEMQRYWEAENKV